MTPRIPWIRSEFVSASPYQPSAGGTNPIIHFDLNTLPTNPSWWQPIADEIAHGSVSSYPDAAYQPLKDAIAGYLSVGADQIVPTAGGDEAILLSSFLSLTQRDRAVVARPTYPMHAMSIRMTGAEVVVVEPLPGPNLRLDLEGVIERAAGARLVWLCSPNNPTGEDIPADVIRAVCERCPGLVCVDQAYLEFSGEDHLPLLADYQNLLIIRTFSKGWGLGALRTGYAVANPLVAGALDALRPPGSLSTGSALGAQRACQFVDAMKLDVERHRKERQRLTAGLRDIGFPITGEAANFTLVETPWHGDELARQLNARGMAVRTYGHDPLLQRHFRACIGLPEENDLLLAVLRELQAVVPPTAAGDVA